MKTEEKNTKRFWRRGNVLDIAIVLLLLASVFSIGFRYYQANYAVPDDAQRTVLVTFEVKDALPAVADMLKEGEIVYLRSSGEELGHLRRHSAAQGSCPVAIAPAQAVLSDELGNFVSVAVPDGSRKDLTGVVACRGTLNENGAFLLGGRYDLTPGQTVAVYTERVSVTLTVLEISTAISN